MPQTTKSNGSKPQRTMARNSQSNRTAKRMDAIALLKADHRQVENWFEEFDKSRSESKKHALGRKICAALRVHTTIEEEIFYPVFLAATEDEELHHEAVIEHDGARRLIVEIENSGPEDEYYEARVKVLSELIEHHVKEEEQRGGLFAKARSSEMDLEGLGARMAQRKRELERKPETQDASASHDGRLKNTVNALLGRQASDEPARAAARS